MIYYVLEKGFDGDMRKVMPGKSQARYAKRRLPLPRKSPSFDSMKNNRRNLWDTLVDSSNVYREENWRLNNCTFYGYYAYRVKSAWEDRVNQGFSDR